MSDTKSPAQRQTLTCPKGIAEYPHLNKPDTKFKSEGEYHVKLHIDEAVSNDTIVKLGEAQKEALEMAQKEAQRQQKGKGKKITPQPANMPYYEAVDEDGNETGSMVFHFKSKASGTSQRTGKVWTRKLAKFDAKGQPTEMNIFGGSLLKAAYKMIPWVNPKCEYGVKMQIEGIQVIDLVTAGGAKTAKTLGFGEEDGGFVDETARSEPESEEVEIAESYDATSTPEVDDDDDDDPSQF